MKQALVLVSGISTAVLAVTLSAAITATHGNLTTAFHHAFRWSTAFSTVCPACRVLEERPGSQSVEPFQYAETSHVLHVFFFRVLKKLHDHRRRAPVVCHTPLRGIMFP